MCRSKAEGGRRCASRVFRPTTARAAELARVAKAAKDPAAEHERLLGGQSSVTELVTTPAGERVVRKSAPAYLDPDDHRFMMDGEVLASELANAVGAPVATVRRDGPDAVWVEYVEGSTEGVGRLMDTPAAVRIGLVDAMTNYQDRESGLRATAHGLMAFDSGGSWLDTELDAKGIVPFKTPEGAAGNLHLQPGSPTRHFVTADDRYRTDPPISGAELSAIRTRVEGLRPKFEALGRAGWLDSSLSVLDRITTSASSTAK